MTRLDFDAAAVRVVMDAALLEAIESVVSGWYADRAFDWDDVFDRLERWGFDLPEEWDDPLCVSIKAYARKVKRESA